MVNQYLFIEEGSLAPNDIAKIVEHLKNTGTSIIMYNKGCAKPELVSINSDGALFSDDVEKKTTDIVLAALYHFMESNTDQYESMDYEYNLKTYATRFKGTRREFLNTFEDFLKKYKGE